MRLRSHDDRLMSKASGFFEAFTQGWLKTNWMDIIIVLLIMNFCLSDALNEKTTFGQKQIALPALFISFHVLGARDGGRWHQLVNATVTIHKGVSNNSRTILKDASSNLLGKLKKVATIGESSIHYY